jgi:hypothetical protein
MNRALSQTFRESLLNDAYKGSNYVLSNGSMIIEYEFERMRKEAVVVRC